MTSRSILTSATPDNLAIRAVNLSKHYKIGAARNNSSLLESTGSALSKLARRIVDPSARVDSRRDFWALNQVSFEVSEGEVLGVIGRNGSGKSTLLKILARITAPTDGYFETWGRVGALLEVGTGFHPDLTGRENVFLNGSILGMTRRNVLANFDSIVDFSGVSEFIDTPVKFYSSGMYVRLAFAVAAHLETEILLLDEVLAVGDVGFQQKCRTKVKEMATDGRSVVFVSHDMSAIQELCGRVILLDHGLIHAEGKSEEIIPQYMDLSVASA
jgi:lipopolysaccharide transport system ATP-binding protein